LTIGAMADPDLGWVDFGLETDLTAMTASGDFHRHFSLTIPPDAGRDDLQDHLFWCCEQWRTAAMAIGAFAITVLTAGNEHVRKLGIDRTIST